MKIGRKCLLLLMCMLVTLMLAGCKSNSVTLVIGDSGNTTEDDKQEVMEDINKKSDDIYDEIFEKYGANGSEADRGSDKRADEYIVGLGLDFYNQLKNAAPYIAMVSIVSGFLLFLFARGNKRIRKFGLFGLMIGLPLMLLMIVYGIGYAKKIFIG